MLVSVAQFNENKGNYMYKINKIYLFLLIALSIKHLFGGKKQLEKKHAL